MRNFPNSLENKKYTKTFMVIVFALLVFFTGFSSSLAVGPGQNCDGDTRQECTAPYTCTHKGQIPSKPDVGICGNDSATTGSATDVLKNVVQGALSPITWIADAVIQEVVNGILFILVYVIGFLFALGGWFIDFSLSLNSEVLNLPVVRLGWGIVRDVANLGFVLGILVIAFATIIRNQTYGMKKTLFKMIVIAVLINFSLSICGVFLDASAIFTNFFIGKATGNNPYELSAAITQAFKPQSLLDANGGGVASITGNTSSMLKSIASLVFVIIFSWMGIVSYFALGAMLMTRFVWIAFLLILAPIAWLGWVFPGLSVGGQGHIASLWWNRFIKWTFFPPIVSFFLYLALFTIQKQSAIQSLTNSSSAGAALGKNIIIGSTDASISFTATIGSMFVFCALMMGGLIAANKLGIEGAGMAENWAGKASSYLRGKARGAAKGTGRLAARALLTTGSKTEGGETTSWMQRRASQLATFPVLGRLGGRKIAEKVSGLAKDFRGDIKKTQESKYSKLTNADLINRANNLTPISSNIERAAIAKEVAARKLFAHNDMQRDSLGKLIDAADRTGTLADIEKKVLSESQSHEVASAFPSRDIPGTQMTAEESMKRHGSAGKAPEFSIEALSNANIVSNFTASYISKMASDGSGAKQQRMVETIQNALLPAVATELKDVFNLQEATAKRLEELNEMGSARSTAEQTELRTLQAERRNLKTREDTILANPANGNFAKLLKEVLKNPLTAGFVT